MKSIRDTKELANQEEHLCHLEDIGNKLHLHPVTNLFYDPSSALPYYASIKSAFTSIILPAHI